MSLPKPSVHERLCSECPLPKADSVPRSSCRACSVCKRLFCMHHLRKHAQRRGVQKKQLGPCEAHQPCYATLPSVAVKGAPKSISNDDALCAYAASCPYFWLRAYAASCLRLSWPRAYAGPLRLRGFAPTLSGFLPTRPRAYADSTSCTRCGSRSQCGWRRGWSFRRP